MDIQWYPGHMMKAKRQMLEDIKLIDIIFELVDARAPAASRNPDLDSMGNGKARLILMNKADLADEKANKQWQQYFQQKGFAVLLLDSRSRKDLSGIPAIVKELCKDKLERNARRGIKNRPLRAMVVGIPNVGKSTFINSYGGKAVAKTGNKPGVTRGNQWIRLDKDVQLLDTPGILWGKFEDRTIGEKLALIGSINDEITEETELAIRLIEHLKETYPGLLLKRYEADEETDAQKILEHIAKKRGCIIKGGEISLSRAAKLLIDDFRSKKLGRITLEYPETAE